MKTFLVVLLAVIAVGMAVSERVYSDDDRAEWSKYKTKFEKSYEGAEDTRRMGIYMDTKQRIAEHNEKYEKGEFSFSLRINQFADLLPAEVPRGLILPPGSKRELP